jgi:hypothetical protein
VLAAQRASGNHAVARALAARRLPAGVRAGMEAAFGSPFDDVRVHDASSQASGIGAVALTRGSDIHFAPGAFDPASERGLDLIGHELAHVVQQRQGRVAPTGGVARDPELEREADALGARAARGTPTGAAPTRPLAGAAPAAQAKFGFEFQTGNSFVEEKAWLAKGTDTPVVGEKELAFEDTTKKFKVEGDQGYDDKHFDVEFITAALNTLDEAKIAVEGAAALAKDLGASGRGRVRRGKGRAFDSGSWKRDVAIDVTDANFRAKPQGSVGVSLAEIPRLLRANLLREEAEQADRRAHDLEKTWKAKPSPALDGFLQLLFFYIDAAGARNRRDPMEPESFPTLGHQVIVSDGPKASFSIMARTDFHGMFTSLDPADQRQFIEGVLGDAAGSAPNPELAKIICADLVAPLIAAPYRADKIDPADRARFRFERHRDRGGKLHDIVMEGPSILDWLLSVATGKSFAQGREYATRNRDMLSAPVGWGSRAPGATGFPASDEIVRDKVYGMGAYPMDEAQSAKPLAVFELRTLNANLATVKLDMPGYWEWWPAALAAATKGMDIPEPAKVKR